MNLRSFFASSRPQVAVGIAAGEFFQRAPPEQVVNVVGEVEDALDAIAGPGRA